MNYLHATRVIGRLTNLHRQFLMILRYGIRNRVVEGALSLGGAISILTYMIFHFVLVFRREHCHVKVYRICEGEPSLVRIRLSRECLEKRWHWLAELLHVRFPAQRIVGDIWLRA